MAKELILKKHFESVVVHGLTALNQSDHRGPTQADQAEKISQNLDQALEDLSEEVMMKAMIASHHSKEGHLSVLLRSLCLENQEEKHMTPVQAEMMIVEILKSEMENPPLTERKQKEDILVTTIKNLFKEEKVLRLDRDRSGPHHFAKLKEAREALMIKNRLPEERKDQKERAIKNHL